MHLKCNDIITAVLKKYPVAGFQLLTINPATMRIATGKILSAVSTVPKLYPVR